MIASALELADEKGAAVDIDMSATDGTAHKPCSLELGSSIETISPSIVDPLIH